MKEGIHPKYGTVTASCACGNTFVTRSTKNELKLEICSACHPVFTGKQKFVDSAGRIDKFLKKLDQAKVHDQGVKDKKAAEKKAAVKAAARRTAPAPESKAAKKSKTLTTRPVAAAKK